MPSIGTVQLLLLGIGLLSNPRPVSSDNATNINNAATNLSSNASKDNVTEAKTSTVTTLTPAENTETMRDASTSPGSSILERLTSNTPSPVISESTRNTASAAINNSETSTNNKLTMLETSYSTMSAATAAETPSTILSSLLLTTTSVTTSTSKETASLTGSTNIRTSKMDSTTIKLRETTQRSAQTAATNTSSTYLTKIAISTTSVGTTQKLLSGGSTGAKAGGSPPDYGEGLIAGVIFAVAVVIMVVVALAFMNARRLGPFRPGKGYTAHHTSNRRRKEDRRALYNDLFEEE